MTTRGEKVDGEFEKLLFYNIRVNIYGIFDLSTRVVDGPRKVKVILEWSKSTNATEFRSFHRLASMIQHLIPLTLYPLILK